jgi:hypothetical protein
MMAYGVQWQPVPDRFVLQLQPEQLLPAGGVAGEQEQPPPPTATQTAPGAPAGQVVQVTSQAVSPEQGETG